MCGGKVMMSGGRVKAEEPLMQETDGGLRSGHADTRCWTGPDKTIQRLREQRQGWLEDAGRSVKFNAVE